MSEIDHGDRAHSKLGASSTKRWMNCPGSIRMNEGIPNRDSDAANEGTMAHEMLEHCLNKEIDALDLEGEKFKGTEVPNDMIPAVQEALRHIRSYLGEGKTLGVEEKFSLEWLYPDMFGTNDVCIREDFGDLHIMDYKHGFGTVEVENNSQLLFYAIGAAYSMDFEEFDDYERVFLHIIQPRASHPDGTIRVWETSIEYLKEFAEILRKKAIETTKPKAALNPSDDACQWCNAKSLCPAIFKESQLVAKQDFGAVEVLNPEHLPMEKIVKILEKSKLIIKFIESCEERAKTALMNGEKVPGLKVVRGNKSRNWNQGGEEMEDILNDIDIDELNPGNVVTTKIRSVAQIEKLVGKKKFKKLSKYVTTNEGGLKVVPESDKRGPAKLEASADFEIVK